MDTNHQQNLTPNQRKVLAAMGECASITRACEIAGVTRTMHYDWLKDSEAYRAAYALAFDRGIDAAEAECIRRGQLGTRRAVWHKGKVVGYEQVYSDRMLEVALRAHKPERYRDRTDVNVSGTLGVKRLEGVDIEEV